MNSNIFLIPQVRNTIWQYQTNPSQFHQQNPQLNAQFMIMGQRAFPMNINQLFQNAGANTLSQQHQLLQMLMTRYTHLGLPARYRFGPIAFYIQWLDNHPLIGAPAG